MDEDPREPRDVNRDRPGQNRTEQEGDANSGRSGPAGEGSMSNQADQSDDTGSDAAER